ncbi:hypothetical protein [Cohnella soli]|uniref:Uncharacterized protein n=1 Tax=Cohnella soli TaxID=425005 RepID=A0ABW0HZM2_9BACL
MINKNPEKQNEITIFEIAKLLNIDDFTEIFELTPAYQVAELIGIRKYQWLSYDGMERDKDEFLNPNNMNPNIVTGIREVVI